MGFCLQRTLAWGIGVVEHLGPGGGDCDFCVTDRCGVGAVHAGGKGSARGSVRAMQAAQPGGAAGAFLAEGSPEGL